MTYKQMIYKLIEQRKAYGVSRVTLAETIGIAESLMGSYETFKKTPNTTNFINWCEALDLDLVFDSPGTVLTREWQPSNELITWCENQEDINYAEERENFKDYYIGKGNKSKDWTAIFRLWIRRARKFNAESRAKSNRSGGKYDKASPDFVRGRRARIVSISDVPNKLFKAIDNKD